MHVLQVQDLIKDFADEKGRLATLRSVKHHCQYRAQLKAMNEGRGISLVSDTGWCCLLVVVGVGECHPLTRTHRNGKHYECRACRMCPNRQPGQRGKNNFSRAW